MVANSQTEDDNLAYSQVVGLTINDIARASPDLLSQWAGTPPDSQALNTHGLLNQNMSLWWQAQLKHYGIFFQPLRKTSTIRTRIRRQIDHTAGLSIPRYLLELERQLHQQRSSHDPIPDDRSSTLMTPPISDEDEASRAEHDRTLESVDAATMASNPQPAKPASGIAHPSPASAISRKRKASDFPELDAKRVALPVILGPGSEHSSSDTTSSDDDSSNDSNDDSDIESNADESDADETDAASQHLDTNDSNVSSSSSLDSDESDEDSDLGMQLDKKSQATSIRDERLVAVTSKTRELGEDHVGLKVRARLQRAPPTNVANLAIVREIEQKQAWSAASRGLPDSTMMAMSGAFQDVIDESVASEPYGSDESDSESESDSEPASKKYASATEIFKAGWPYVPIMGKEDVHYWQDRPSDLEWNVTLGDFCVDETGHLFIHDYRFAVCQQWIDPIIRASRCASGDRRMRMYYAQLMHRGLPLTRAREVAKWTLRTTVATQSNRPRNISYVKQQLKNLLAASLNRLKASETIGDLPTSLAETNESEQCTSKLKQRDADRNRRRYCEHSKDIEPWMEETGPSLPGDMSSYDRVMHKWLDVRSQIPAPALQAAPAPRPPPSQPNTKASLVSRKCPQCRLHLRLCKCKSCAFCGELTESCDCEVCSICDELIEHGECECEDCEECSEKVNETKKVFCECYCGKCEQRYTYLEDGDSEDGCGCRMQWRKKREYGDEVRDARDARRAEKEATKVQQQKEEARVHQHTEIQKWIKRNRPGYWKEKHRSVDAKVELGNVSGTYILLSRFPCSEKQDLSITTSDGTMMGRYRYSEIVHGLFCGGVVPTHASTNVVPCTVAVEDFENKNGDWWYGISSSHDEDYDNPDNTDGIMFLGGGLIKISPHFFADVDGAIGNAVFGMKVDPYCEDFEALQESWLAIRHKFQSRPSGVRNIVSASALAWDEELVDDLVGWLCGYGKERGETDAKAPHPADLRDSIATHFIARNLGDRY